MLQLKPKRNQGLVARARVTLQPARDGESRVRYEGRAAAFEETAKPQPKARPEPKPRVAPQPYKPAANADEGSHRNERFPALPTVPWKSLKRKPHSHSLDDADSLFRTYEQNHQGTFLLGLDTPVYAGVNAK